MITKSLETLERTLPDDALVLDVGGYIRPYARADWVIDIMPYDGRGPHGRDGTGPERFMADTWVQRDICAPDPWPFEDKQFDFVTCSQTLEDIRDPVGVCAELNRVAKAGYVELPCRRANYFPDGFHFSLSEEDRVQQLWWDGSFRYEERPILDMWGLDQYLAEFVGENYPEHGATPADRALRRVGTSLRGLGMKLESRGRRQARERSGNG